MHLGEWHVPKISPMHITCKKHAQATGDEKFVCACTANHVSININQFIFLPCEITEYRKPRLSEDLRCNAMARLHTDRREIVQWKFIYPGSNQKLNFKHNELM